MHQQAQVCMLAAGLCCTAAPSAPHHPAASLLWRAAGCTGVCSSHCDHARGCCGLQGYSLWSQAQALEWEAPSPFTSMATTEDSKFPLLAHRAFQHGPAKLHPWLRSEFPAQKQLDMGAAVSPFSASTFTETPTSPSLWLHSPLGLAAEQCWDSLATLAIGIGTAKEAL